MTQVGIKNKEAALKLLGDARELASAILRSFNPKTEMADLALYQNYLRSLYLVKDFYSALVGEEKHAERLRETCNLLADLHYLKGRALLNSGRNGIHGTDAAESQSTFIFEAMKSLRKAKHEFLAGLETSYDQNYTEGMSRNTAGVVLTRKYIRMAARGEGKKPKP